VKSSVETLEGNKVKLYIEVDEAEFDKDIDRAFRTIARDVKLPGFRNGKVPRRVLEARIGLPPAREQALRDGIPNYLSKAVREHDVDLISTPEIAVTGGEEEGLVEFEAECDVRPEITVPGYAGLRIELDSPEPTEEELQDALDAERRKAGSLEDVDRAAADGDYLTLDLAATRDGEELPGLNTEDWSYELGQGWVAEDFDEHLNGASAGDDLEFTAVPKGTEEPADFKVSVKAVQELSLPDVTDEWVEENFGEYESVSAWSDSVREEITESKLNQVRQTVMGKLTAALTELVEDDPPDSMVTTEMQNQVQNMARQLQGQGIDLEAWMSATGQDPQQFLENTRPQAISAVKADLALRAIAVAESMDVSDDEIEIEYARMAMQYGQKAKDVRKVYERNDAVPELIAQIRTSKAMDWLLHNVEMVDPLGAVIDRELVLGHNHDDDEDDDEGRNDEPAPDGPEPDGPEPDGPESDGPESDGPESDGEESE
jgi:trigger factor